MTRNELIIAAEYARQYCENNPDEFKTKRRAPGVLTRCVFWLLGLVIGTVADKAVTDTASNPAPVALGLIIAAAFVYFDPPAVRTTHTLKSQRRLRRGQ